METIFVNTENNKTSEPHRFKLDLTDQLNLKNLNKDMALVNLSIYYTWKNIKSTYKSSIVNEVLETVYLLFFYKYILPRKHTSFVQIF